MSESNDEYEKKFRVVYRDKQGKVQKKKYLTPKQALDILKSKDLQKSIFDKTKEDWIRFTHKHKISQDLINCTKSKTSYFENFDFLTRTQAKKDDLAREARIKGMGK